MPPDDGNDHLVITLYSLLIYEARDQHEAFGAALRDHYEGVSDRRYSRASRRSDGMLIGLSRGRFHLPSRLSRRNDSRDSSHCVIIVHA